MLKKKKFKIQKSYNMVKSLQKICLKSVFSHLYLNYGICKRNNLKIPRIISDEIFNYLIKFEKTISDDEAKIFNKDIMDVTEFI